MFQSSEALHHRQKGRIPTSTHHSANGRGKTMLELIHKGTLKQIHMWGFPAKICFGEIHALCTEMYLNSQVIC